MFERKNEPQKQKYYCRVFNRCYLQGLIYRFKYKWTVIIVFL